MKHSAALKVKVGDQLALNSNKDGVLFEVIDMMFPMFIIREVFTESKPKAVSYCYFQKPTAAQLNAHKKRKEKYYADRHNSSTGE
jgi:hypothetical protein